MGSMSMNPGTTGIGAQGVTEQAVMEGFPRQVGET